MGRAKSDATIEVHEGVYLKRPNDNSAWQCYFRLNGNVFRKSTKTKDVANAKLISLGWYQEAQQDALHNPNIERVSFRRLRKEYLEHIQHDGKSEYQRDTLERHFSPFFEKYPDVSKIKDSDFLDYLVYRRNKSSTPPALQTLNRENVVIRQMLKFAKRKGWVSEVIEVTHFDDSQTKRRRENFTISQYIQLCHTAQKRIHELEDNSTQVRNYRQRQLLFDYIKFLTNCGMRVDESKTVRWKNVSFDGRSVDLKRAGKRRSTRKVLVRGSGISALKRIKERRERYLEEKGQTLSSNEHVFCASNGQPIKSFRKGFDALLKAAGFEYDTPHDKHSLTSLRHSYATFRLTTRRGERISMRGLSMQMGTSERMIQEHYGHDGIALCVTWSEVAWGVPVEPPGQPWSRWSGF